MNTLRITWSMPLGHPGEDAASENPLARSLDRLLRDGQPFGRLCHCYFASGLENLRWLGVFVQSAGDRVLYFPGFAPSFTEIQAFRADQEAWNQAFLFDHATLEPDRQTWHVTSPRSRQHLGRPRTLDIGEGSVLWFGLSVASVTVLRPAFQQTTVIATVPQTDSRRRAEVLKAARDGSQFQILQSNTELPPPAGETFLQFGVVVSSAQSPDYSGPELGAPFGSPFLAMPLPNPLVNIPIRRHRVALSDSVHLQITTALLPGRLNTPVSLTSPSLPTAQRLAPPA